MKKILKILVVICLLPLNIFACPHVDKNGFAHLQTYNEDYSEMNMIYPEDGYLYVKNVPMTIENNFLKGDEDNILMEIYSFPLILDKNTYMTYYWFLDESLTLEENYNKDIETTVKNIENINVGTDEYNMDVNFKNTYQKGLEYEGGIVQDVYYDVIIDCKENDDDIIKLIKDNNLVLASNEVLQVSARFNITETDGYDYNTYYDDINNFYDNINITVSNNNNGTDVVVINLEKEINEDNYIIATLNENNEYQFVINEKGTYVVLNRLSEENITNLNNNIISDIEINEDKLNIENIEDENLTNTVYIILGIAALIVLLITIIIISKKHKKK